MWAEPSQMYSVILVDNTGFNINEAMLPLNSIRLLTQYCMHPPSSSSQRPQTPLASHFRCCTARAACNIFPDRYGSPLSSSKSACRIVPGLAPGDPACTGQDAKSQSRGFAAAEHQTAVAFHLHSSFFIYPWASLSLCTHIHLS